MDFEKLRTAMIFDPLGAFETFINEDNGGNLLTSEQMVELLVAAGRDNGPAILVMAYPWAIEEDVLAFVIGPVWTAAEFPEQALGRDAWDALFSEADCPGAPRWPKKTTRLWRGAPEHRARGMSWTRDRELAEWFARRSEHTGERGYVWTTKAGSRDILCVIDNAEHRGESEYVLDPVRLTITRA